MYIPNSFSPDYDGVNDLFCIYYNGVRTETFLFNIYDRFSSLVYSTDNINDLECLLNTNGWNGKHQKDGTPLPTEHMFTKFIYKILKVGNTKNMVKYLLLDNLRQNFNINLTYRLVS